MQIITKNYSMAALMKTYQTANFAKFDHSPENLSRDIVLTDRRPEQKKKKKEKKKRTKKKRIGKAKQ